MNETQAEVTRIISETLEITLADVQPEMNIRSLQNVESIRILNVILKVEKRFDIELPDDATFRIETVAEFVALVERARDFELRTRAAVG